MHVVVAVAGRSRNRKTAVKLCHPTIVPDVRDQQRLRGGPVAVERRRQLPRVELRVLQPEAGRQVGLAVVVEHAVGDVVAEHGTELERLGGAAAGQPDVVAVRGVSMMKLLSTLLS